MEKSSIYLLFVVAMMFLFSFARRSGYIEKRTNRLYSCSIICNIVTYLCYIGREFAELNNYVALSYIVNTLVYYAGVSICFFLLLCICERWDTWVKIAVGLEIFQTLFCLISPFTGMYFVISKDGIYSRGQYSKVSFAIGGIFATMWIARMLINYKDVEKEDRLHILFLGTMEVLAIMLQAVDNRYKLEYFGGSFVLMLMYVFMIETDGKYDKMTGVGSRRYYYNIVSKSIKEKEGYSVMFFDANGLKNINDHHGHEAGDSLIQALAQSIMKEVSGIGQVFRLGGDEFIAIIKSNDEEKLNNLSEAIQARLSGCGEELGFEASTSVGIAIHQKGESHTDTEKRADEQMYLFKENYYSKTRQKRREQ